MSKKTTLLWFMTDERIISAIRAAISVLAKDEKFYLVGGTVRNALYFDIHGERLPQRDFDLAYVGKNFSHLKEALELAGFIQWSFQQENQFTMVWPDSPEGFRIVMDISGADEKFYEEMSKVDFTIGGLSVDLCYVFDKKWKEHLVGLPETLEDIREKRLRIHSVWSRSLFRCIRFMHYGFKVPSRSDVWRMITELENADPEIIERNVRKIQRLVPAKAIERISRELGVADLVTTHLSTPRIF